MTPTSLYTAAYYLSLHDLPDARKQVYARAFRVEGDFDQWLDKTANRILAAAERCAGHDLGHELTAALSAARQSAAARLSTASSGIVQGVGGSRTETAYRDADRAYWSSLVRGPYNEAQTGAHLRLARERREAWERWKAEGAVQESFL